MIQKFETINLPDGPTMFAPDGAEVRVLSVLEGGSFAHFRLPPRQTSRAVEHRTVEEIWYVVKGTGRMWRRQDANEEIVELIPGICITIPMGKRFQFQSGDEALEAVAVTMPPWPGQEEAVLVVGRWPAVL